MKEILDREFVREELRWWNIPGLQAGICRGEDALLLEGYGLRDLDRGLPMTPASLGGIASCSKSFTSALAGMLADEGLVDLDRPVAEYLPDFALMDDFASRRCTLRDMLYHRTGLAGHDAMWPDPRIDRRTYLRRLRYLEPNVSFRSKAQYSNTVYNLIGAVLEEITGETWETMVQNRIFAPLSMERSTVTVRDMRRDPDFAVGYFGKARLSPLYEMEPWEMDVGAPAAGVNSCAQEMLRYLALHIQNGEYRGQRLISDGMTRQMHHAALDISAFPWQFPEVPGIGWYGMAWKTTMYRDLLLVYHCGEIEGYCSIELFIPREKTGMFFLCNRHKPQTPFLMEMVYTAIDRLMGYPEEDWAGRLHAYETVFGGSCDDWPKDLMPAARSGEAAAARMPDAEHDAPRYVTWPDDRGRAEGKEETSHGAPRRVTWPDDGGRADTGEEYIGIYENPAYGQLEIARSAGEAPGKRHLMPGLVGDAWEMDEDGMYRKGQPEEELLPEEKPGTGLLLLYKKWRLPLEKLEGDLFRVTDLKEDTLYYTVPLAFVRNGEDGKITGFTLALEETVAPVFFRLCQS